MRGRATFSTALAGGEADFSATMPAPPKLSAKRRLPLGVLGVAPATAHITVAADRLVACFGPRVCRWPTTA